MCSSNKSNHDVVGLVDVYLTKSMAGLPLDRVSVFKQFPPPLAYKKSSGTSCSNQAFSKRILISK